MKNILILFLVVLFFSGCSFFSDSKKVINIQNVENDENDKDVQNVQDVQDVENVENNKSVKIANKLVAWGFAKSNGRKIDTLIIHSSYNAVGKDEHNLDDIIYKEYQPYGVSPHYIISREGKTYRLVEDKNIAYHAGVSQVPDGRTGVNNFSLGIEIVNTQAEKPNDAQYGALGDLIKYLKNKYDIKYVLGHSEIAPGRKDDPWNFEYNKIR